MRNRSFVQTNEHAACAVGGRRRHGFARPAVLVAAALGCLHAGFAAAAVSVLRPPREATTLSPLQVTLVYSGDQPTPSGVEVPEHLDVTLTNGDVPPRRVTLTREAGAPARVELASGELKAVRFSAPWPDWARGAVRVDVPGMDVSPVVVLLTRKPAPEAGAMSAGASAGLPPPATPGDITPTPAGETAATAAAATPVPDVNRFLGGRLSTFEPIYFADGSNGENIARFQFSFKFRLVIPDDPRSRGFVDNLYFAYTQTSLWDIRKTSGPFRDTSYMPQLIYSIPDTGWKSPLFSQMGLMAGFGHESNGRDGPESRSVDILFVRPTWEFGDVQSAHLTVSPKIYYYVVKADENHDIADYRGYVDLLVKYGSPDGAQLAATLRKGARAGYGSIDTQFTYPLAKLFRNAWGGYLWIGYFNGYGEDILDYNKRRWIARIGFSIAR